MVQRKVSYFCIMLPYFMLLLILYQIAGVNRIDREMRVCGCVRHKWYKFIK